MGNFLTLDDFEVGGRRVLVRADLNVPMRDGRVTDGTRIERLLPTLSNLIDRGARIVVLSHFGRPKGKIVPEMSLRPLAAALGRALGGVFVQFAEDCVGPAAEAVVTKLGDGDVALLENLRFHPGEEENDADFAAGLAALGEFYVNDAFSCAHRAHASTTAIAALLPAAAGLSMQAELDALAAALEDPQRPVAAVVGGAKVSTKLDLLGNLIEKVDRLIIGGGMANTFLNALGADVGRSLCERDMADRARAILSQADRRKCRVMLPSDVVAASAFEAGAAHRTVPVSGVPSDYMILDIGPQTAAGLAAELAACKTLLWNGPLGAFELEPFDAGTNMVARAAARLTRMGALKSVAGGGDTVAALAHAGVVDDFTYVSTAGGAFLEWLEGRDLPGVAALRAAAARRG